VDIDFHPNMGKFIGVDPSRYCHEDGPYGLMFLPLKNGDNLGMVYY
jgi:hypothetical protein